MRLTASEKLFFFLPQGGYPALWQEEKEQCKGKAITLLFLGTL